MRIVKRKPNKKTLIIDITIENEKIKEIIISGDFFANPPEEIDNLQENLRNKTLEEAINQILSYEKTVELLGISWSDIIEVIREAYQKYKQHANYHNLPI